MGGTTHEFCTLFDRYYLPRALALYRSLARHAGDFVLRALCMDDESERLLRRLGLPKLELIPVSELEAWDPALAATRQGRSRAEYCWTATPTLCRYVLEQVRAPSTTYIDADQFFFSSPDALSEQMGDGSIVVVPHLYKPTVGAPFHYGRFVVGWLSLRNDANSAAALRWWRERCLEWCHDRNEPTRFGDQKYLEAWPTLFAGVRMNDDPANALGPWNVRDHAIEWVDGETRVDGRPLVNHHFSGVRLHGPTARALAVSRINPLVHLQRDPEPIVWIVESLRGLQAARPLYESYAEALSAAVRDLRQAGADPSIGMAPLWLARSVAVRLRAGSIPRVA